MDGFRTKNRRLNVGIFLPSFRRYPDSGADLANASAVLSILLFCCVVERVVSESTTGVD